MNPTLKVTTTNRDELSFQRNHAGDVEVFKVNRTGINRPNIGHAGTPIDSSITTIKKEEVPNLTEYFLALQASELARS